MNPIKILFFVAIAILAVFLIQLVIPTSVKQSALDFLATEVAPSLPFYDFFKEEVVAGTLKGLVAFVTFANIPFLPNPPVEPYAIFAFSKGLHPILIVLAITATTLATSSINYFLGYLFGPRLIEKFTGKPFIYSKRMDFFSAPITFMTHLLPLPNIFPFLFGAYRSNYKNFALAVLIATAIRFSAVLFIFHNYGDVLAQIPLTIMSFLG